MGYEALEVLSTGKQAIEFVEREQPDLILMDIQIQGDIDGVETAGRIRERLDVPIVYLTAFSDEATLQRAKATEAFAYVLKPFKDRELHKSSNSPSTGTRPASNCKRPTTRWKRTSKNARPNWRGSTRNSNTR